MRFYCEIPCRMWCYGVCARPVTGVCVCDQSVVAAAGLSLSRTQSRSLSSHPSLNHTFISTGCFRPPVYFSLQRDQDQDPDRTADWHTGPLVHRNRSSRSWNMKINKWDVTEGPQRSRTWSEGLVVWWSEGLRVWWFQLQSGCDREETCQHDAGEWNILFDVSSHLIFICYHRNHPDIRV